MTANDLILQLRSRLGDTESKKWNDIEMLDNLNIAYIKLARELRLFMQEIEYDILDNLTQNLPANFLDAHKVVKNKRDIPIQRAFNATDINSNSVSIDNNTIIFHSNGKYKLIYYCYYILVSLNDEILLPFIANNALIYYAMHLLLQKKPHQNALQESSMYKNMFDIELKELQRDIYRQHETKLLTSPHIVV